MLVTYSTENTVLTERVTTRTKFTSQLFPGGFLLVVFPNKDGVVGSRRGISSLRYSNVHRTIEKA